MKAALQLCVALCALGISMPAFGVGEVIKNGDTLVFGSNDRRCWQGHFIGLFDEFRLRGAASSADWIKAEYGQAKTFLATRGICERDGGRVRRARQVPSASPNESGFFVSVMP